MRASLKGLACNSLNILLEWTYILKPEYGQKLESNFVTNIVPYSKITSLIRTINHAYFSYIFCHTFGLFCFPFLNCYY